MCGICGVFDFTNAQLNKDRLESINNSILHRGPDFGSVQLFGNVAFGHRRLSIIDLTEDGNQPMFSLDNRYCIVFNGEVYNFLELKKGLIAKGVKFKTNSDTEVVLNSYIYYGVSAFSMFNGMFALAIYDTFKKELILSRDQFGIKPLYYYHDKNVFIFSSEKKAILKDLTSNVNLNKQSLVEYIWFGNPLGDNTFYKEITEITPGNYIKIKNGVVKKHNFFNINSIQEIKITEEEAIKKTINLFENSIKRHLISDVPVAVLLSGGIDSSAITAFASKHYKGKLKTYSIAFDYNKGDNELSLAAKIARKYNTDHTEIHITGNDLIDVLESLANSHDEPFADSGNIPLYLISKKLKGSVKVILQGDGGDEFFGGYSRYNTIQNTKKWKFFSILPMFISLTKTKNTKILRLQRFINAITEKEPYIRNALLLTMESKYSNPLQIFNKSTRRTLKGYDPFIRYKEVYENYDKKTNEVQSLFYTDSQIILKDTFLEKVDKSTMANSIEVRVPFLDKDLTEFALSLPPKLKIKNGVKKYLLKKSMEGFVPNEILYGSKKGFGVPYGYWLGTSLQEYFLQQISTKKASVYIDQIKVLEMFNLHQKEKGNFGFLLWKTLILCIWLNKKNNSL